MAASASRPHAGASEEYEDLLPVMGERLGTAGLLAELRAGFRLLADPARGAITPDSLRRGAAAALGVAGMAPAEAAAMVREGDADGDGALSEAEFCVLMIRLSPGIMADAEAWLADAIADELRMMDGDGMAPMEDDADAAADDGDGGAGGQDHATARPAGAPATAAARRSSV
ncbi:calcium-binding protein KIC-like [Miscanthus floridulus]|uniref:calcium-binding protein KIC-like n=1 Tax=Miscanthus floridulus TaxID=154761 RepID=UPI003459092D